MNKVEILHGSEKIFIKNLYKKKDIDKKIRI